MKVLLIDNGTTLLNKLEDLIPGKEMVKRFDTFKDKDSDVFDLTILSGGSVFALAGNEDKFREELDFARNTDKPLIGICFGFELITVAFGGEIKELGVKDKGIKEIEIVDSSLYGRPSIKVYESHGWGVSRLPEDFSILAKSETGPEIIKHKTLPIYGFQFHPENFVDKSEGDEIFIKLFSKLQVAQ